MKQLLKERLPKMTEVVFVVSAPQAKDVYVAGDFNDWQLNDTARMEPANGSWRKRLNLSHGKYHYRFVIDGEWIEDSKNPAKETNPFGSVNSLIEI